MVHIFLTQEFYKLFRIKSSICLYVQNFEKSLIVQKSVVVYIWVSVRFLSDFWIVSL